MFSGIIENSGVILQKKEEGSNLILDIASDIAHELYVDQSIAHDGVCLTVVSSNESSYRVIAIKETLEKTNLGDRDTGDHLNLEKAITADKLLDGHIVQGHVDTTAKCLQILEEAGSHRYTFELPGAYQNLIVDKGSVTVNGISLTVVDPNEKTFSVAIIPYTYTHTNLSKLKIGDRVNLEFDILGKYIDKYLQRALSNKNLVSLIKNSL